MDVMQILLCVFLVFLVLAVWLYARSVSDLLMTRLDANKKHESVNQLQEQNSLRLLNEELEKIQHGRKLDFSRLEQGLQTALREGEEEKNNIHDEIAKLRQEMGRLESRMALKSDLTPANELRGRLDTISQIQAQSESSLHKRCEDLSKKIESVSISTCQRITEVGSQQEASSVDTYCREELTKVQTALNTFNEYLAKTEERLTAQEISIEGTLAARTAWRSHNLAAFKKLETWINERFEREAKRSTKSALEAYRELLEVFRIARSFTTPDLDKALETKEHVAEHTAS